MEQNQMNSGEFPRENLHAPYGGYEGISHSDDYSSWSGQKLSTGFTSSSSSSRQRLTLAILSLVQWVIVFIITGLAASSISPGNPSSRVLYPLLIIALLVFSVLTLIVNILFHRGR